MDRVNRDGLYFADYEQLHTRFVAETDRAAQCQRIADLYGDERYRRFAAMHRHVADRIAASMWKRDEWLAWEQELTPSVSRRVRVAAWWARVRAWWMS